MIGRGALQRGSTRCPYIFRLNLRFFSEIPYVKSFPQRNFPDTRQIGLIAQDVEKVLPELVHTDSDGYKSLSYDKLTAVLVEAVKELKAQNEKLQARVEALEGGR